MSLSAKTRKIRSLLLYTNLTQSEIARRVGVQRQHVLQVRQDMDENPYVDFDGLKLKIRREALGLSMTQFAKRANVSTSQVSRWEAGTQSPWPSVWRAIAKTLGCTVQDLEKE